MQIVWVPLRRPSLELGDFRHILLIVDTVPKQIAEIS